MERELSPESISTVPCPSSWCPQISKWISLTHSLVAFQIAVFLLGFRASKAACKPSKRGVSISCTTLGTSDVSPIGFLSQTFWGSSLLFISQELGYPMWGTSPCLLLLWEKCLSGDIPPYCVLLCQGRAFPTHLNVVLSSFVMQNSSSSFQICFRGKWSIYSDKSGMSMGEGEFRIFLHCHPGCLSYQKAY